MTDPLTDQWHACQQRVYKLEREYAAAMVAYFRGEGPLPPSQMKIELLAARKEADELLSRALGNIDRRMADLGRRLDKL